MSLLVSLIGLFFVGFIQDMLGAYYLRLVTEQRLAFASFINFVHNIIGWAIFVWFMYLFKDSEAMTGLQALVHSIGSTIGTYYGLKKPQPKL